MRSSRGRGATETEACRRGGIRATVRPSDSARKEADMVPLLLWILGVPGVLILLLLLLGIIHL